MKNLIFSTALIFTLNLVPSQVGAQTVATFGWDDYANYSGTQDDSTVISGAPAPGHHYDPALADTTMVGPSITTTASMVNGPLSIPAQQNYVQPANFAGIYSAATADGLEFADNHSNIIGSGLWHASTVEWSLPLEVTGTQFVGFNSGAVDFGGFLIFNSGNTRTINLALAGGAVFSDINFLTGYSDEYTVTGLNTPNVTMTFVTDNSGIAVYNPEITGSFTGLTITQSDMAGMMSTNEPVLYYRQNTVSLAAVPEPSAAILLGLAGAMTTRRRRRA